MKFRCPCGFEWYDVQPTYRGNFQDYPKCPRCGKQMREENEREAEVKPQDLLVGTRNITELKLTSAVNVIERKRGKL